MSLRRKLLIAFISLMIIFTASVTYWSMEEGRNVYAYAVEEILVDVAKVFSEQIQEEIKAKKKNISEVEWSKSFSAFKDTSFAVQILNFKKTNPALDVYITDERGIVIYSSRDTSEVGKDYSKWNDVALTLKGQYGTRATQVIENDKNTTSYYIASPIQYENRIVGVVTVIKARTSVSAILDQYLYKIIAGVGLALSIVILFGFLLFVWITRPIDKLKEYAVSVSSGKRTDFPDVSHKDIKQLAQSFEEMRISLEGRKTAENFIQTLIHELKSPLSAIKGSGELLLEPMNDEQKEKFLKNIILESNRSEVILEKILKVAELETQKYNLKKTSFNVQNMLNQIYKSYLPFLEKRQLKLIIYCDPSFFYVGDEFLIGQVFRNLIQNAIDFSYDGSEIKVIVDESRVGFNITVEDVGVGIPEYAEDRIFEKFYSLERPSTGKKGTGLGLNFVKEVVFLHNGRIQVIRKSQGVLVRISFPV